MYEEEDYEDFNTLTLSHREMLRYIVSLDKRVIELEKKLNEKEKNDELD